MDSEDFLANVKQEGTDPFADLEKDIPSDPPTEKEPEKDEPAAGESTPKVEDVPFHKHPRWIERETELKSLRDAEAEHSRELQELKTLQEETAKRLEHTDSVVPDWFKELYGDNASAWRKYEAVQMDQEKKIEQRILDRQEEIRKAQIDESQRWNKWVDGEIEKLQSEGNTFDRNKLIKTMLEYRPTDESNNFDFKAGLKIYQALEAKEVTDTKGSSDARKELADAAIKTSRNEPPKKDYMTPADLRHRSWSSLE